MTNCTLEKVNWMKEVIMKRGKTDAIQLANAFQTRVKNIICTKLSR